MRAIADEKQGEGLSDIQAELKRLLEEHDRQTKQAYPGSSSQSGQMNMADAVWFPALSVPRTLGPASSTNASNTLIMGAASPSSSMSQMFGMAAAQVCMQLLRVVS